MYLLNTNFVNKTNANFKRKFEKLGYSIHPTEGVVRNDKFLQGITTDLRTQIKSLRNSTGKDPNIGKYLTKVAKDDLRGLTGGLYPNNSNTLNTLEDRLNIYKHNKSVTNNINKQLPKTKLLTGKNLAIGTTALATTALTGLAINKLRKARSDKNKKRGKYNK